MSNNTFDEVGQMFYDRVRSRAEAAEQRARELEQQLKEVKGSLYATEARVKELEADVVALREALGGVGGVALECVPSPTGRVFNRCPMCLGVSEEFDGDPEPPVKHAADCILSNPHPGQPLLDRLAAAEAKVAAYEHECRDCVCGSCPREHDLAVCARVCRGALDPSRKLLDRIAELEAALIAAGPHQDPGKCPLWYDGCHCLLPRRTS